MVDVEEPAPAGAAHGSSAPTHCRGNAGCRTASSSGRNAGSGDSAADARGSASERNTGRARERIGGCRAQVDYGQEDAAAIEGASIKDNKSV